MDWLNKQKDAGYWLLAVLLVANFALALGPWFVRLADTGPVAAGFWRLFLALPFLALFARASGQRLSGMSGASLLLIAAAGTFFALDLASWHIGIERTRMGNAALFGNSGSVILMIWGFVIGQVWPRRAEWIAMGAAITGALILMSRSFEISSDTLIGDLFALMAGVLYAAYLLILQRMRERLGHWSVLFWSSAAGAPVLLVLALVLGEPVWPQDWRPVLSLFITSQLIGQGLMVYCLRHFSPLVIGLALLTQPAIAGLIGWSIFSERLGLVDIAGMMLVGSALVLARATSGSTPDMRAASRNARYEEKP